MQFISLEISVAEVKRRLQAIADEIDETIKIEVKKAQEFNQFLPESGKKVAQWKQETKFKGR